MSDDYTPREALQTRATAKTGTEREVLTQIPRNLRAVVAWKLAGLDEESAKRSMVASATTLLGIVHHLAWVEAWWFQEVFAGRGVKYPFDWDADPDAEFRMSDAHTIEGILDATSAMWSFPKKSSPEPPTSIPPAAVRAPSTPCAGS